jgi:hypothetical protein
VYVCSMFHSRSGAKELNKKSRYSSVANCSRPWVGGKGMTPIDA